MGLELGSLDHRPSMWQSKARLRQSATIWACLWELERYWKLLRPKRPNFAEPVITSPNFSRNFAQPSTVTALVKHPRMRELARSHCSVIWNTSKAQLCGLCVIIWKLDFWLSIAHNFPVGQWPWLQTSTSVIRFKSWTTARNSSWVFTSCTAFLASSLGNDATLQHVVLELASCHQGVRGGRVC